jgi:hypothetical protein
MYGVRISQFITSTTQFLVVLQFVAHRGSGGVKHSPGNMGVSENPPSGTV